MSCIMVCLRAFRDGARAVHILCAKVSYPSPLQVPHGHAREWPEKQSRWVALMIISHGVSRARLRAGRFRPDFLDRCQWDAAQHACTGSVNGIIIFLLY